jgi:tetratricopeptide (TPR) repeat protein
MLATHRNNKPIIDILSKILSYQQYLDELVLLACNYIIYGNTSKRDQAYGYFEKALSLNTPSVNTTLCEAYEFRCECQTLDELALIREDDNAMRIYALLVSERLLLRSNQVKHFLSLLMKQSDVYKCYGSFHRCLQLRLYAYRLVIETEHKDWRNPMLHKNCLFELVSILFKILQKENSVPVETLAVVWIWILNRADNKLTKCLFKLIFMTTYVSIPLY